MLLFLFPFARLRRPRPASRSVSLVCAREQAGVRTGEWTGGRLSLLRVSYALCACRNKAYFLFPPCRKHIFAILRDIKVLRGCFRASAAFFLNPLIRIWDAPRITPFTWSLLIGALKTAFLGIAAKVLPPLLVLRSHVCSPCCSFQQRWRKLLSFSTRRADSSYATLFGKFGSAKRKRGRSYK